MYGLRWITKPIRAVVILALSLLSHREQEKLTHEILAVNIYIYRPITDMVNEAKKQLLEASTQST
jgi:hypothetical protein